MGIIADGESIGAVVALTPPAIKNAEVEAAVATGLHATGAGSFERAARIVQPDITAGNHLPADVHVVVLYEHEVAFELAVFAQVNDVLDEALALVVARMGLARENELNGPLFVVDELHDISKLLKDQRRALVRGEAAGKTDGQRIGIEQVIESDEVVLRQPLALNQQTPAAEFDQLAAQVVTQRPKFLVRDKIGVSQPLPEIGRVHAAFPGGPEPAPPEPAHRTFHPTQQMDAVGDVADGNLVGRPVRKEAVPHLPAHLTVQFADSVGGAGCLQRQHGHAERFVVVLGMDPP